MTGPSERSGPRYEDDAWRQIVDGLGNGRAQRGASLRDAPLDLDRLQPAPLPAADGAALDDDRVLGGRRRLLWRVAMVAIGAAALAVVLVVLW